MKVKFKTCGKCGEQRPIWATHDEVKYCKTCWLRQCAQQSQSVKKPTRSMIPHRSPIKPKTSEVNKPKKIPNRSKKRTLEEQQYSKDRKVFLQEHPNCCARIPGKCSVKATEVHHMFDGSDRDKYFLTVTTWLAICRGCHNWVHSHVKEAKDLGFLK